MVSIINMCGHIYIDLTVTKIRLCTFISDSVTDEVNFNIITRKLIKCVPVNTGWHVKDMKTVLHDG